MSGIGLLAVQVSDQSAHPAMPGRSGIWGITIMGIGLALTCHGILRMAHLRRWRARAIWARGRVMDNVPRLSGLWRTTWSTMIEFEALDGPVTSLVDTVDNRVGLPLGQQVDVLYDPAFPQQATLADRRRTVSGSLILGIVVVGVFLGLVT